MSVLTAWCDNCDNMLRSIEGQVEKVNGEKREHITHKAGLDAKMKYTVRDVLSVVTKYLFQRDEATVKESAPQ